jgi:hypothetical protein
MTTTCDVSIRRKSFVFEIYFSTLNIFYCLASLRIERGLKDIDAAEGQEVSLEVVLSKSDARGKWLKGGKVIYPDQK